MEKRNLGYFLLIIGIIFLIISMMTIWALTFDWDPSNGIYLLFSIPLLIFSTTTIASAIFLIYQDHLSGIVKGLILILDGLVPTFAPIYALFDARIHPFSDIRGMVLIPLFLVGVFIIVCILSALWPFWDRYWLSKELENVCVYGTKNSVEDTRKFLSERMKEKRYDFSGDDFSIEKDEKNRIRISITYTDEISVLGKTLKELSFTVERSASEKAQRW